jgi:hypothetical protein
MSQQPATRKSIAVTRSFGRPLTEWDDLEQSLMAYTTRRRSFGCRLTEWAASRG